MRIIPQVKICCISSVAEADMAVASGAYAVGLVSAMPSGPGVIDESLIARIVEHVAGSVRTFLLTSRQNASGIIAQHQRCKTTTIQICDHLNCDEYPILRERLPGTALVQVIHVGDESSITEAKGVADYVDAILLDSGNQKLDVKELGGTGRIHNWAISARIRKAVQIPVFLAGGLHPDNVSEAIAAVGPFGVDICSGVRTNGQLDADKLSRFIGAVRDT